jgi:hypothetical protein
VRSTVVKRLRSIAGDNACPTQTREFLLYKPCSKRYSVPRQACEDCENHFLETMTELSNRSCQTTAVRRAGCRKHTYVQFWKLGSTWIHSKWHGHVPERPGVVCSEF